MFLDQLPNELFVEILKRLPPRDRFRIRNTSRKIFSLVDSVSLLPLPPCTDVTTYKINIDFECQVLLVSVIDRYNKCSMFALVDELKEVNMCTREISSPFLTRKIQALCLVDSEQWKDNVDYYLRRFSKTLEGGKNFILDVRLDQNDCLSTLRLLTPMPKELIVEVSMRPLLDRTQIIPLDEWMRSMTSNTTVLQHNLELNVSQMERVTDPVFSGYLDDDAAVYVFNQFRYMELPSVLYWSFKHLRVGAWSFFIDILEETCMPLEELVNKYGGFRCMKCGPWQLKLSCQILGERVAPEFTNLEIIIESRSE